MKAFIGTLVRAIVISVLASVLYLGIDAAKSYDGTCSGNRVQVPCSLIEYLLVPIGSGIVIGLLMGVVFGVFVFLGFRAIHYLAGVSPGNDV